MRRRFFNIKKLLNNFINYTSSDNQIVTPYATNFGSVLLKNVMIDGVGTLLFKSNVTKIGGNALYGCTLLVSITIPDSVTEIGYRAFNKCSSLNGFYGKFVSEDNRCLIIDGEVVAFAPAGLTSYTIPDSVTTIGVDAFSDCKSLTNVTIGNGVTTIGDYAFNDCDSLTSVTIPNSVTTIRERAFGKCTSLISVTIPDSVTTIGVGAFQRCDSLTNVTIGNGITTIGYGAFYDCSSLTSVYCKSTTPPALGSDVFRDNATDRKIYVPYQSLDAYKTASKWSEYADNIVGYDFENDAIM